MNTALAATEHPMAKNNNNNNYIDAPLNCDTLLIIKILILLDQLPKLLGRSVYNTLTALLLLLCLREKERQKTCLPKEQKKILNHYCCYCFLLLLLSFTILILILIIYNNIVFEIHIKILL